MTQLNRMNECALDSYLRGEHGEFMRQVAGQELYERGQRSAAMTEEEMIAELVSRGYVVYRPDD